MIVEYTLTKEDLFEFNFYAGWSSPEKKNFRIKYYLKTALSALASVLFVFIVTSKTHTTDQLLVCVVFGLLIGLISAYAGIYFFYKRKIERFINDPKNSNLLVRTELIISDNGIINKDEFSEVNYNWNAITKKVINKDYIYLFLNSVQAIVIPKKALSNEEEKQLSDLLSRNLSLKAEFSELYPT